MSGIEVVILPWIAMTSPAFTAARACPTQGRWARIANWGLVGSTASRGDGKTHGNSNRTFTYTGHDSTHFDGDCCLRFVEVDVCFLGCEKLCRWSCSRYSGCRMQSVNDDLQE